MSGPVVAAPRPASPTQAQVAQVRAFNRFYTNVIGVLHDMYLDTPYTVTESRVLFEIARLGTVEVPWLRQALDIDPGYLSRVLGRFESDGLVTRHRSAADARRQEIRATEAGNAAVAELDARAVSQIGALLSGVDCGPVLDAMRVITQALGRVPDFGPAGDAAPRATLRPLEIGDLGWILRRHGELYATEFGWDASFEGFCAQVVAEYVTLRARYPGRAAAWIAEVDGMPAGSVCCVPDVPDVPGVPHGPDGPGGPGAPGGPGGGTTARLRLLLVEPWARGRQLGARLVDRCLDFARAAGYTDIVLLTYDQLAAARHIYQAAGFTLDSEHPEDAFGQHMMCQNLVPPPVTAPGDPPTPRDPHPARGPHPARAAPTHTWPPAARPGRMVVATSRPGAAGCHNHRPGLSPARLSAAPGVDARTAYLLSSALPARPIAVPPGTTAAGG